MTLLRTGHAGFEELPLYTRRRNPIPNEYGHPVRPREAMEAAHANFMSLPFGLRLERRSADSTYNCCGMVFANRRTAIDPLDLSIIYQDEYRTVPRSEALEGDVAVYRDKDGDIVHVGVILRKRIITTSDEDELIILSQWGWWGEYIHRSRDVPPGLGELSEVWTDRV